MITNKMSRRKQNRPQHITYNSQNVDLETVSIDNNLPGDIFRLKVTNDDPVTTGIFTVIPLPRGSRFGPFKCGIKVSDFDELDKFSSDLHPDPDCSGLQPDPDCGYLQPAPDCDAVRIEIQTEAGFWVSLLTTTGNISYSNIHLYLHDSALWCEIQEDLAPDTQLVAMLLIQSCDLRAHGPNNNNNGMKSTIQRGPLRLQPSVYTSINKGVALLSMPATYRLVPAWHYNHKSQQPTDRVQLSSNSQRLTDSPRLGKDSQQLTDSPRLGNDSQRLTDESTLLRTELRSNANGKRSLEEAGNISPQKSLKCDLIPSHKSPSYSWSPSNSPRREHSPPITGAFKCGSCPYTADKKSWLVEHVLQQHIEDDSHDTMDTDNQQTMDHANHLTMDHANHRTMDHGNPPTMDHKIDSTMDHGNGPTMDQYTNHTTNRKQDHKATNDILSCNTEKSVKSETDKQCYVRALDSKVSDSKVQSVSYSQCNTKVSDDDCSNQQSLVPDQGASKNDLTCVSEPINLPEQSIPSKITCSPKIIDSPSLCSPCGSPIDTLLSSPMGSPVKSIVPSPVLDSTIAKTDYTFKTKEVKTESLKEDNDKLGSDPSPDCVKSDRQSELSSKRSSDSPVDDWVCDACDISFTSESTYTAHKQFYCGLRAKKPRLNSASSYTLMPTMMLPTPMISPTSMLGPTPMITPFGMTFAVPYLVPMAPALVSPDPPVEKKEAAKKSKTEEQPLDLSCRKAKLDALSPTENSSIRKLRTGSTVATSSLGKIISGLEGSCSRKLMPSVSRCEECNIVFYKHENYMVHKQHYCAGRRGKLGVKTEKPPSPTSSKSTPPVSPTSQQQQPEARSETSSPGSSSEEYTVQYFCLPCKIQFSSPDTLEAHQQYYCPARSLIGTPDNAECPHCDANFSSLEELARHLCTHTTMKIPMYCCPYCQYVAQSDSRLLDHIKSHAPTKAYRCTLCGYRGNTVRGMRMHGKSHLDAGEKFTDEQMIEYEEPPLVPKRLRTVTENVAITTEAIHITNERKRSRSKSMSSCDGRQGPHICVECNSMFIDTNKLRDHMQSHLQDKYLNCKSCDFVTDMKAELLRHVKITHELQRKEEEHDVKNEVKNSAKYTIENLINNASPDVNGPKSPSRISPMSSPIIDNSKSITPLDVAKRLMKINDAESMVDQNKNHARLIIKKEPGEISPKMKATSPLQMAAVQNSPVSPKLNHTAIKTKSVSPKLNSSQNRSTSPILSIPLKIDSSDKIACGLEIASPPQIQVQQPINYCSQCDIKFVYLSTFLAHKKYYCSSHAGERRATVQV